MANKTISARSTIAIFRELAACQLGKENYGCISLNTQNILTSDGRLCGTTQIWKIASYAERNLSKTA